MSRISEYNGADPNGTTSTMTSIHMTGAAYLSIVTIPSDGNYTIGFWIRAVGQYECNLSVEESTIKQFDVYRDWTRVEHTFEASANQQVALYLPAGDYYIWHAKLESGNKATDYSQSYQDVNDQIKSTEKTLRAEIDITAESILQNVSKTFQDYSTKEEMNTAIEQSATELDLSLDKKLKNYSTTEEVNNAINISKEGVEQTVSKTQSKWDIPEKYKDKDIKYGYGHAFAGDYYVDVETGIMYITDRSGPGPAVTQIQLEEIRDVIEAAIELHAEEIVLKVDDNGKLVAVALTSDPKDGTEVAITADNISMEATDIINLLAGNSIDLTAKKISFISNNFTVSEEGNADLKNATVSGTVNASALNIIKDNKLYGRMDFGSTTIYLGGEGMSSQGPACGISLVNTTYGATDRFQHVGIGFLTPYNSVILPFAVYHDSMAGTWDEGYSMGFGGWITAHGYSNTSTRLAKENVESLSDEEARKILDVNVVSFDYSHGGNKNQRGVIYEEVKDIIPSVTVCQDKDYEEHFREGKEYVFPGVDYSKFVPYLIKMVQIQQDEIDELKQQLEEISSKL